MRLNHIIFFYRSQSSFSITKQRLRTKPLPQSLSNADKQRQQSIKGHSLETKSNSSDNIVSLTDRELRLTISNKFQEPLLSIDQVYLNPSIRNNSQQKSKMKVNDFIQMPVTQARLLIQRIYKLAALKFQVDKSISSLSMDRWTETPLESGLLQQLYTYRVPGMLYGEKQSILYLSVLRFEALRHSEDRNKTSSEEAIFVQQITKQPLIYISQHLLQQNIYHLWTPSVRTIEVPIDKIFELACRIDAILTNFNEAKRFGLDKRAKENLASQKPRFDLNNKDPISYFATPIGTPRFVKEISRRLLRFRNVDIDKRHEKPEISDQRHNLPRGETKNMRDQPDHVKMFLEKLEAAISIKNVMKERGDRNN